MESRPITLYRGCKPVIDAQYLNEGSETPVEVIIGAIASAAGVDPLDLPPLYEYIDTDSLNKIFQQHEGTTGSEAVLSFRYENWNVFVRTDGRIRICDGTQPTAPQPVFDSKPASA